MPDFAAIAALTLNNANTCWFYVHNIQNFIDVYDVWFICYSIFYQFAGYSGGLLLAIISQFSFGELLGHLCKRSRGHWYCSKSWSGYFEHCCCWKVAWCCSQGTSSSSSSKNLVVDSWDARALLQIRICQASSFCCRSHDRLSYDSWVLEK